MQLCISRRAKLFVCHCMQRVVCVHLTEACSGEQVLQIKTRKQEVPTFRRQLLRQPSHPPTSPGLVQYSYLVFVCALMFTYYVNDCCTACCRVVSRGRQESRGLVSNLQLSNPMTHLELYNDILLVRNRTSLTIA